MNKITSFNKKNLQNIKGIFEEKTGVELSPYRNSHRPFRTAIVLTAALACFFTLTAFAENLFSSLSGDDLSFNTVYEGNGNEQYVCYETSALIYSDLTEYIRSFVIQRPDIRYDEQVENRVENIYAYFHENIGSLFFTR